MVFHQFCIKLQMCINKKENYLKFNLFIISFYNNYQITEIKYTIEYYKLKIKYKIFKKIFLRGIVLYE